MKVIVFNTKPYDRSHLVAANRTRKHELTFVEPRLTAETAVLARGFDAACLFVSDHADAAVLETLHAGGIRCLSLRCAGFNHVDLDAAARLGLAVGRVPAYSPHAVAEHAVALILALNRNTHRAYARVREGNFALQGLVGFDLHGRTVGVVGTGQIGVVFAQIMRGFGCRLLGFDIRRNPDCEALGMRYVPLPELLQSSDIVSLHCPLTAKTHHMINSEALSAMKNGVMIINTGRGALIDSKAAIQALKTRKIGYLGLDVYEEEEGVFFEDLSSEVIEDDVLMRLLTFPNVMITSHQAFLTGEALENIAETTLDNLDAFETTGTPKHPVAAG